MKASKTEMRRRLKSYREGLAEVEHVADIMEQQQRPPKSYCACGHLGDGGGKGNAHAGLLGHGPCTVKGCGCFKFTWERFV